MGTAENLKSQVEGLTNDEAGDICFLAHLDKRGGAAAKQKRRTGQLLFFPRDYRLTCNHALRAFEADFDENNFVYSHRPLPAEGSFKIT